MKIFLGGTARLEGTPRMAMHGTLHLAACCDGQFHQSARLVGQRTRLRGRSAERIVGLENLGILFLELEVAFWQFVWTRSVRLFVFNHKYFLSLIFLA